MISNFDETSDNKLEDYFLHLIVGKKSIEKEIWDLGTQIEKAKFSQIYTKKIKELFFGKNNLFLNGWWSLSENLQQLTKNGHFREHNLEEIGLVIHTLFLCIERLFDVDDKYMTNFIMNEKKEDIEQSVLSLIKKILDAYEMWISHIFPKYSTTFKSDPKDPKDLGIHFSQFSQLMEKLPSRIIQGHDDDIKTVHTQIDSLDTEIQKQVQS